jgi:hypothetical protein
MVFVRANSTWQHLTIRDNGVAHGTTGHTGQAQRFFEGWTGGFQANENLTLENNRLEQQNHGKGVEISTNAGHTLRNLRLVNNRFGTILSQATTRVMVHVSQVRGSVEVRNNVFLDAGATGLRLELLRQGGPGTPNGHLLIENNEFRQTALQGGIPFNIVAAEVDTTVRVGLNALLPFYGLDFPTLVYPINETMFTTVGEQPLLPSAPTLALSPWSHHVQLNGTATITTIIPTWRGHIVTLRTAPGHTPTFQDDTGNLRLAGDFVTSGEDQLTVSCDGVNWTEISRSVN